MFGRGKEQLHVNPDPNSERGIDRTMDYILQEGAAFDLEIAEATRACFVDVSNDLKSLIKAGLVKPMESQFGLAPTYAGTKKSYKLIGENF